MRTQFVRPLNALVTVSSCSFAQATHYKLLVLTGQSNSLGMTAPIGRDAWNNDGIE